MKRNLFTLAVLLAIAGQSLLSVRAQGTFQNLNFESATLPVIPSGQYGGPVSILSGIPRWKGYMGNNQVTQVLHNNMTLGSSSIDILGPNFTYGNIAPIDGNYSVLLQPGASSSGFADASIAENGTIPSDTSYLQFKAWVQTSLSVSFNGHDLTLVPISTTSSYVLYSADLSSFAGQTGELRFTAPFYSSGANNVLLDSISFAVPEPSVFVLGAMGVGCLLWWKRKMV
jgi:hypothetical protein